MSRKPLLGRGIEEDDSVVVERIRTMTKVAEVPFALVDRNDLAPLCPHCKAQLNEVYRKGKGFPLGQGRTLIYFCPNCLKALGFAQGRVF